MIVEFYWLLIICVGVIIHERMTLYKDTFCYFCHSHSHIHTHSVSLTLLHLLSLSYLFTIDLWS